MTYYFTVAELDFELHTEKSTSIPNTALRPYQPFQNESSADRSPIFRLYVDETLSLHPQSHVLQAKDIDTGNGVVKVETLKDGGYQFLHKNVDGQDACALVANADGTECHCRLFGPEHIRRFGLSTCIMICYAYAASFHQAVLIHASLVRHNGHAYAFVAKSGTGKSTHVSLWLRHIENCDLMNDDNPVLRIIDGKAFIYGSPWSGKTPCYRNVKAPLGAICAIVRDTENKVIPLGPTRAFSVLLPSCSTMIWDKVFFDNTCNIISKIIQTTPVNDLHCLPNEEAARVCHRAISKSPINP